MNLSAPLRSAGSPLRRAALCCLPALAAACSSLPWSGEAPPWTPPDPDNPMRVLAVMPLANDSHDVDAPAMLRKLITERLEAKHYQTLATKKTDRLLAEKLGVTLGAHLGEVPRERLAQAIAADGFVFGRVVEFKHVILGFQDARRVCLELWVEPAGSAQAIWRSKLGAVRITAGAELEQLNPECHWLSSREGYTDFVDAGLQSAKESGRTDVLGVAFLLLALNAAVSVVDGVVASLLNSKMIVESTQLLNVMMADLPSGPGRAPP